MASVPARVDPALTQPNDGGVVADLQVRPPLPLFVAPSTSSQLNTYRPDLFPVAYFRIDDLRFGFGSSFVNPGAMNEFQKLAAFLAARPGLVASVFGHADPVGTDDDNKTLSGRRATAVYGMLVRDTALWERLFSKPVGTDDWGLSSIQLMLDATGHPAGALDGVDDDPTNAAIRSFQSSSGLPQSGKPDAATRAALFHAYMEAVCVDDSGQPFTMLKTAFLGGGADSDGKADYQGCGDFNPTHVFSEEEAQGFDATKTKTARDAANATNRRVVVYLLFRPALG